MTKLRSALNTVGTIPRLSSSAGRDLVYKIAAHWWDTRMDSTMGPERDLFLAAAWGKGLTAYQKAQILHRMRNEEGNYRWARNIVGAICAVNSACYHYDLARSEHDRNITQTRYGKQQNQ